ncbi:MAG: hypothetical protein NTV21_00845 [Planctomycetota bacterium]|nr:hypothetical protein [Planctomycetota bacterium]
MNASEPSPLPLEPLERAIAAVESGTPYKAALEALLRELDDASADRLMQLQREARGTWFLALKVPQPKASGARALFVGNALSGAHTPLSHHGFEVTLLDSNELRLRWARLRNEALSSHSRTHEVRADGGARLPFGDGEFDLVVQEDGLPSRAHGWGHDLVELARVCKGELVLVADNRLGYKRSTGRRGVFDVPSPLAFARRALAGPECTLPGYSRLVRRAGFGSPRSFALYPHASEFTFLVGLDGAGPSLEIGPKERENKLKLLASSLGLFRWMTPSFAVIAPRRDLSGVPRWSRILGEIERVTGERGAELEHVVATRGNSALLLTRSPRGPEGAWCLHVGLSAAQRSQLATHMRTLRRIRAHHPLCPVPEPLFEGELDGVYVTVERRIGGLTAPQLTGDLAAARRTLEGLAPALAGLVVAPPAPLDEAGFEELLGRRFEIVAAHAGEPAVVEALARLRAEAKAELLGCPLPRVVHHADLRSKHVQVEPDGELLAVLDWGSAESADLPYFDLLHHILHERKQADGLDARGMWELVRRENRLRDWERAALERYRTLTGVPEAYCVVLHRIYPMVVAAMAERHWDFSRPYWLRRQFGLGAEAEAAHSGPGARRQAGSCRNDEK